MSGDGRLSVRGIATAKMKVNECFALWLSSPNGESFIDTVCQEMLAASRHIDPNQPGTKTPPPRESEIHSRGSKVVDEPWPTSPGPNHHTPARESPPPRVDPPPNLPVHPGQSPVPENEATIPASWSYEAPPPHLQQISLQRPRTASPDPKNNPPLIRPDRPLTPSITPDSLPCATFDDIPCFFRGANTGQQPTNPSPVNEPELMRAMFGQGVAGNRRPGAKASLKRTEIGQLCTDVFKLPAWSRVAVFQKILEANGLPDNGETTVVRFNEVKRYYDNHLKNITPNRRLFELFSTDPTKRILTHDNLCNSARLIVEYHPGLQFLTQQEFQDLYCKTVAIRICYHLERNYSRTVTWSDWDRSDVPELMRSLDDVSDINQVLRFFSYEHFYVLYCRFWELDRNRDHKVGLEDLLMYSQGQIIRRVLERVVQGYGRQLTSDTPLQLDFEDFVYFCLSEEDKNTTTAKKYWFNILDLEGDGILSGHELEYFFEENVLKLEQMEADAEAPKYQDMMCQMLDMLCPDLPVGQGVRLSELRRCETAEHFFNMIMNAPKFLQFEHRDPYSEHILRQANERTAWDRFARLEYDRMAQEATQ